MTGEPVGGHQNDDGHNSKSQPSPPSRTGSSGQSKGPAPEPGTDQKDAAISHKQAGWPGLALVWRGVRHTTLTDWLIIMLTAVIAYSTWSSDKTFERQLVEMRATGAQTDRAIETSITNGAIVAYQTSLTERALRLAERNGKTSEGQLATAQDTANRQLRAYLHVRTRPLLHFAAGEVPEWGIEYSVLGQTPAYDVQVRQLVVFAPYPMPVDITRSYLARPFGTVNKVAIFAGEHPWAMNTLTCITPAGKKVVDCKLSQEEMTALANDPATRLYVIGLVRYKDAFGATHQTPYCFSRDPSDDTSQICPRLKAPD